MKKKIDKKIRKLIENAAIFRHRGIFIIIGDRGRDQIGNFCINLFKSLSYDNLTVIMQTFSKHVCLFYC